MSKSNGFLLKTEPLTDLYQLYPALILEAQGAPSMPSLALALEEPD